MDKIYEMALEMLEPIEEEFLDTSYSDIPKHHHRTNVPIKEWKSKYSSIMLKVVKDLTQLAHTCVIPKGVSFKFSSYTDDNLKQLIKKSDDIINRYERIYCEIYFCTIYISTIKPIFKVYRLMKELYREFSKCVPPKYRIDCDDDPMTISICCEISDGQAYYYARMWDEKAD